MMLEDNEYDAEHENEANVYNTEYDYDADYEGEDNVYYAYYAYYADYEGEKWNLEGGLFLTGGGGGGAGK